MIVNIKMKPYRVATFLTLLIAFSSIKGALAMSKIYNENQISSNDSSQSVQNHHKQDIEQSERIRRLIPYMAFYIPKPNRDYLSLSDINSYKQMPHQKPYIFKDPTTISQNYNNDPRHPFIVNGGVIGQSTTLRPPLFKSSAPQLPIYVGNKNHNGHINHNNNIYENPMNNVTELHAIVLNSHSQQMVNNQYVTPVLDLIVPQPQYQQIANHYNLHAEVADLQQSNQRENSDSSYITPFLPSNQVPGPFRPILHLKHLVPVPTATTTTTTTRLATKQSSHPLSAENVILRQMQAVPAYKTQTLNLQHQIDVAQQTDKPVYYLSENSQQPYIQHGHQYQPQLISTTEQPINNNIEEPIQKLSVPLKTVNINQSPIITNNNRPQYQRQQHEQRHQLPQNPANQNRYRVIKAQPVHTNIKYDLDPDDGYGHVLLPYDSYFAKDQGHQAEQAFSPKPTNYPIAPSNIELTPIKPITVESITNNYQHQHADTIDGYDSTTLSTDDKMNDNRHQTSNYEDSYKTDLNSITNINTESIKYEDFVPVTSDIPNQSIKMGPEYSDNDAEYAPIQYPSTQSVDENYDLDDKSPVYTSDFKPSKAAPGPQSGKPGIDYPAYSKIPKTTFNCSEQRYKGFFGDPSTGCQVWHYCDLNGGQASFLCPNGTIFNQVLLTCDWWFNVKCSTTAQLYVLNERLYKYILPLNPKFPEDYSGPLVDKYLAIKFQEMEEKLAQDKNRNRVKDTDEEDDKSGANDAERGENMNAHTDEKSTELTLATVDEETEKYVANNNMVQLDDDGQSHNIDNAMQQLTTTFKQTNPQTIEYTTHQSHLSHLSHQSNSDSFLITAEPNSIRNDHRNYYASLPPPPKIHVESERAEVVEISSDGTSGHLTPDRSK